VKRARPTREVLSWCLFDFANSSFTTVVITVVFSEYFTHAVAKDTGQLWGWTLALSNLLIIVSAPIIGAIADGTGRKKRFLFLSYAVCIVATAMLYFTGPDRVVFTIGCLIIANFAFSSGENLVAGFLPEIASPEDVGRVSAWGWGIGYVGGLLALMACLPLVDAGQDSLVRATSLVVALFFLAGGIPTFLWVRERGQSKNRLALKSSWRDGISQVKETWNRRKDYPELFRFLLAFFVFSIGVYGVIQFASIIARTRFNLETAQIVRIFIASQITAALGALLSGAAMQKFGAIKFIALTLVLWIAVGLAAIFSRALVGFWALAIFAGFALGSTLASCRTVVSLFCPAGRSGEIFGFWGLFGRIAALCAPAGYSILEYTLGRSGNAGVVYFTISFVVGLMILLTVDEHAGRARTKAQAS